MPADVIRPMVALLVVNIVVLTTWSVIDPLQHETVIVSQDVFGRITETYGVCTSEHLTIFLSVLIVINLGSLLFALLEAWRARKLSTELSESSYIFAAMALILLVSLFGIPVIRIVSSSSVKVQAFYFVMVGIIFVICASILCLIFIPKMRALRSDMRKEALRSSPSPTLPDTTSFGIEVMSLTDRVAQLEKENGELQRLLAEEKNRNKSEVREAPGEEEGSRRTEASGCDRPTISGVSLATGCLDTGSFRLHSQR